MLYADKETSVKLKYIQVLSVRISYLDLARKKRKCNSHSLSVVIEVSMRTRSSYELISIMWRNVFSSLVLWMVTLH